MTGGHDNPTRWAVALAISVTLHGTGIAWLLHAPGQPAPAAQTGQPIAVSTITPSAPARTTPKPAPPQTNVLRPVGQNGENGDQSGTTTLRDITANTAPGGRDQGVDTGLLQSITGRPLPPPDGNAPPRPADTPPAGQSDPTAPSGASQPRQTAASRPDPAQQARLDPLRKMIRAQLDESCLLALPRLTQSDQVGLQIFGAQDLQMGQLTRALNQQLPNPVRQIQILLDQRQCAALDYLRTMPSYPDFALDLRLDQTALISGQTLRGQILDLGGRYLTLLLVDDNGIVHDLRAFLSYGPGLAGFAAPMARIDKSRDTAQLIIALASDSPLMPQLGVGGLPASDFFARLAEQSPQNMTAGIAGFALR